MKLAVKKRFQEMILEAAEKMPKYPDPNYSDTTIISQIVARYHRAELVKLGILVFIENEDYIGNGYLIQEKVLRQLNNLHRENKIAKSLCKGGYGEGRNYTFIRWGKHVV